MIKIINVAIACPAEITLYKIKSFKGDKIMEKFIDIIPYVGKYLNKNKLL